MKKVTSALALAALVGTPAAAMANVEFGGDFDARYYNGMVADDGQERAEGFEQRIRLQSSFEADGGVGVHARLNLMNNRWTGDDNGGADRPFSESDHRNVELDYGYVSIPLAGGTLNVGRQMASWGHNLTLTDDRRDRIAYVRPLGGGHVGVIGTDRRADGGPTGYAQTGHQYTAAVLGPLAQDVRYGFLVVQWSAGGSGAGPGGYVLRGATLVSPYIEGQAGDFNYKAGAHYLGNSRGAFFTEDTFAGYVKGGFQMTPEFLLEGQVLHAMDGAAVDDGYDTYSSLIHSSPRHNETATRVDALDLNGAGTVGQDGISRTLVGARGTFSMMDWTFMGALGFVDYDNDGTGDNEVLFADLQAHYQLTPSTKVYGTAGYADLDEDVGTRENFWASSVNLNVQF